MTFRKVSLMIKTTISVLVGASLALLGPQVVHARVAAAPCRAANTMEVAPPADTTAAAIPGRTPLAAQATVATAAQASSYNRSYEGSHGGSADVSGTRGAAYGPNGAAAGSTRDVSATGPKGQTYNSQQERGAAAGPNGAVAGGSRSTSATGPTAKATPASEGAAAAGAMAPPPAARITEPPATAPRTRHCQPTPAMACRQPEPVRPPTPGYHQTEAVSGSVYAARGAAVRTSYNGYGMYGQGWYAAIPAPGAPRAGPPATHGPPATWPAVGSWRWAGPAACSRSTTTTATTSPIRTIRSITADQPVASADQYYQQASDVGAKRRRGGSRRPVTGCRWVSSALVQREQSDPHYVMQLAVNKSGAIAGNYSDVVSGTIGPHPGGRGQEDPASRLDGRKQQGPPSAKRESTT